MPVEHTPSIDSCRAAFILVVHDEILLELIVGFN